MPRDSGARRDQPVKTAQAHTHKLIGKPGKTPSEKALDRLDKNPNDLEAWDQLAGKKKASSKRGAKKPGR